MKNFNLKKLHIIKLTNWLWPIFLKITKSFVTKKNNINESILIVELHLIGDVVISLPFLEEISKLYPSKSVYVLCASFAAHIIDDKYELIHYDAPWNSRKSGANLLKNIHQYINLIKKLRKLNLEIGIDLRGDIRNILIIYLSGCINRIGFPFGGGGALLTEVVNDKPELKSIQDHHLQILNHLGSKIQSYPNSFISNRKYNRTSTCKYIGVHLGASQEIRILPFSEALIVLKKILYKYEKNQILIFDTKDSLDINNFVINNLNYLESSRIMRWSGNLPEFITKLTECVAFYCMDSGPGHISSALSIDTYIFYGPNVPANVRPLGDNVKIIEKNEYIECRPCNSNDCKNKVSKYCYNNINSMI